MNDSKVNKAVIMARGLGTRMRKSNESVQLSEKQAEAASSGIKAMIPIDRPFLDYVIHNLAEAGYTEVCLVVGPEHKEIINYYQEQVSADRVSISFAIQEEPLGTADAVAAAKDFVKDDHFIVINSDNYYPVEALKKLSELDCPGLVGFERDALVRQSNIPAERVLAFAIVETGQDDILTQIIEKPSEDQMESIAEPHYLSLNCWRFSPNIIKACKSISKSPRGEFELPDAVEYTRNNMNEVYKTVKICDGVLDLSHREDIEQVVTKLKGKTVIL